MNRQKPSHASAPPQPNVGALITNLRLLDLDKLEGWTSISTHALVSKDAGPNQKLRVECAEWILYHLFRIWDAETASDKLQPFFPPLVPLQSLNLRAALFRCLNQLKTNAVLGKDAILRKTMFDDCKGEKFVELLVIFSSLVLRKVVAAREEGQGSAVRAICLYQERQSDQRRSYLPLAIAHRSTLRGVLKRKAELRARYQDLGKALDVTDRDVDRRFDKVVETQEYLDQNIAPEATVTRITRQFNEHWQGGQEYVKAITEGDQSTVRNSLLDQPFHRVWSDVNDGMFAPDFTTTSTGLLEDLESRVAVQNGRLQELKDFKLKMQSKMKASSKPASPVRRTDIVSPKGRATEKQLVFSPRKSPRKSEFQMPIATDGSSNSSLNSLHDLGYVTKTADNVDASIEKQKPKVDFLRRRQSQLNPMFGSSPNTESNDSGFSEISNEGITTRFTLQHDQTTLGGTEPEAYAISPGSPIDKSTRKRVDSEGFAIPASRVPASLQSPQNGTEFMLASSSPKIRPGIIHNEPASLALRDEDQRANDIISTTLNAAATPIRQPLSLVERTRQSMAFVSPSTRINKTDASPAKPHLPSNRPSSTTDFSPTDHDGPRANLVDRTRKSISLVPSKPIPRKSTLNGRRDSRIYPINQFETPRKFGSTKELTPPEELFSPRAGYDSVFKSRPKVGFSPSASPTEELEGGLGTSGALVGEVRAEGTERMKSSRLARMVGKV